MCVSDPVMNFIKSVLGSASEPDPSEPAPIETIEQLLDRVLTSTLLEDRRDACRALKSLSSPYRLELGARGLETLITVLDTDRQDNDTVNYVLDALCNIISGSNENPFESPAPGDEECEDLGIQFTEIFAKKKENVAVLLDLMAETEFKVRYPAIKLLMGLLKHRIRDIQECVLAYPMGVSRLMDLLSDNREIIRNDAILLLVVLTRANSNIQKIVAFESAFDKIFDIISAEGYTDGGVVVEDCLLVLQNLLRNNVSNQNFFKEGRFIQRLLPFLPEQSDDSDSEWPPQKTSNVLFLLQVIRALVSPTNPFQVTSSAQKVMFSSGLLERLCNLLMVSGISTELLAETICTVAEVVRGDHHNQEFFDKLSAPTEPPKPVVVVLLLSMVNEKQSVDLRAAVLYSLECFLWRNELGQAKVIESLLPNSPATDSSIVSSGQLLCGGLFSSDPLTNWFVSVGLLHVLVDNKTQREQLLRVQLATDPSAQPISLLTQVCSMLHQSIRFQKRMGLLMLLGTWLAHCPVAVSYFLNIPTNVPYLTSQVGLVEGDDFELLVQGMCAFILGLCILFNDDSVPSFTKDDLLQLVTKRVGLETFTDKLSFVSKSAYYSLAVQKPQLKFKKSDDIVFDYEFCSHFKSIEHLIVTAVRASSSDSTNGPESNMTAEQHRLVDQYKGLIRDQDQELTRLREEAASLRQQSRNLESEVEHLNNSIQQLKDHNSLLKAQNSMSTNMSSLSMAFAEEGYSPQMVEDLKKDNTDLRQQVLQLEEELSRLRLEQPASPFVYVPTPPDDAELRQLRAENLFLRSEVGRIQKIAQENDEDLRNALENCRQENEDLLATLSQRDALIHALQSQQSDTRMNGPSQSEFKTGDPLPAPPVPVAHAHELVNSHAV